MIEVRAFNENDFLDMLPRMWEAEQEDLLKADPEKLEFMVTHLKGHPAYTMLRDGTAVAAFGVVVNDHHGEAWTWFTPDVRECKAEFEAMLAQHLELVVKDYSLRTVHCGVIKGYEHKMPWVKRLGFRKIKETSDQVRYELCLSSVQ